MATVTGLTAARMLEIEAASIVDGEIIGDNLILTKFDGTPIDAGAVVGPQGDVGPQGPAGSSDPWQLSADTWTFGAADAPSYTITTPADRTATIAVGQRVRLTHGAAVKYFIVTKVAFAAGTTTLTLYGGTDYTLSGTAITLVSFSAAKAPVGFPLDPLKWSVVVTDTSDRAQASPSGGSWYNPGSISISVPIGSWRIQYEAYIATSDTSSVSPNMQITLSTANNSQSDADMTAYQSGEVKNPGGGGNFTFGSNVYREKHYLLAAKTSFFLNFGASAAYTNIYLLGAKAKTIIRAVCAYL